MRLAIAYEIRWLDASYSLASSALLIPALASMHHLLVTRTPASVWTDMLAWLEYWQKRRGDPG